MMIPVAERLIIDRRSTRSIYCAGGGCSGFYTCARHESAVDMAGNVCLVTTYSIIY